MTKINPRRYRPEDLKQTSEQIAERTAEKTQTEKQVEDEIQTRQREKERLEGRVEREIAQKNGAEIEMKVEQEQSPGWYLTDYTIRLNNSQSISLIVHHTGQTDIAHPVHAGSVEYPTLSQAMDAIDSGL